MRLFQVLYTFLDVSAKFQLYNIFFQGFSTKLVPTTALNLTSSIANLVCKLLHESPNGRRLRIVGNIRKISNLGRRITQCPFRPQEIRPWQQQLKNTQKQITNFSFSVQFYWISSFCSKYFVRDCRFYTLTMEFANCFRRFPAIVTLLSRCL